MKYVLSLIFLIFVSCKSEVQPETMQPSLEKATVVSYENLNANDFKTAINQPDAIVIDVRTPEEISEGKIEGALELNFYDQDFLEELLELEKEKDYYLYCKGGGRSAKTARLMIQNGFEKVHNRQFLQP